MRLYVQPTRNDPIRIKNTLNTPWARSGFEGLGQRKAFSEVLAEDAFEQTVNAGLNPALSVSETPVDNRRSS